MNYSDKVINEQGNVATYCAGADARLRYVDINGQDKKYLIEGEGGGGESTVSGLTNEFGTYIKSQTNEAKQLSNIVIDPCKPTNGSSMNVFIKANGTEVISIQNNNISTSVISVGRYNESGVDTSAIEAYLKFGSIHLQFKDQSYFDTFSITNEELTPAEFPELDAPLNFIKSTKNEGLFVPGIYDINVANISFRENAYITESDTGKLQYTKSFDLVYGDVKGIRLKFYVEGSDDPIDVNRTIGIKLIVLNQEETPEGEKYWEEDNLNPIINAGVNLVTDTPFFGSI